MFLFINIKMNYFKKFIRKVKVLHNNGIIYSSLGAITFLSFTTSNLLSCIQHFNNKRIS